MECTIVVLFGSMCRYCYCVGGCCLIWYSSVLKLSYQAFLKPHRRSVESVEFKYWECLRQAHDHNFLGISQKPLFPTLLGKKVGNDPFLALLVLTLLPKLALSLWYHVQVWCVLTMPTVLYSRTSSNTLITKILPIPYTHRQPHRSPTNLHWWMPTILHSCVIVTILRLMTTTTMLRPLGATSNKLFRIYVPVPPAYSHSP